MRRRWSDDLIRFLPDFFSPEYSQRIWVLLRDSAQIWGVFHEKVPTCALVWIGLLDRAGGRVFVYSHRGNEICPFKV